MLEKGLLEACLLFRLGRKILSWLITAQIVFDEGWGRRKELRDKGGGLDLFAFELGRWSAFVRLVRSVGRAAVFGRLSWERAIAHILVVAVASAAAAAALVPLPVHLGTVVLRALRFLLRTGFLRYWLFFARLARRARGGFASAADLDRTVGRDVLEDHAGLFELENLVVAHRDEKRLGALLGAEKERMAERDDLDGVDEIVFLAVAFAIPYDKLTSFSWGDHRFDDRFACIIHWIYRNLNGSRSGALELGVSFFRCHMLQQVDDAVGVPHLVVVPSD